MVVPIAHFQQANRAANYSWLAKGEPLPWTRTKAYKTHSVESSRNVAVPMGVKLIACGQRHLLAQEHMLWTLSPSPHSLRGCAPQGALLLRVTGLSTVARRYLHRCYPPAWDFQSVSRTRYRKYPQIRAQTIPMRNNSGLANRLLEEMFEVSNVVNGLSSGAHVGILPGRYSR